MKRNELARCACTLLVLSSMLSFASARAADVSPQELSQAQVKARQSAPTENAVTPQAWLQSIADGKTDAARLTISATEIGWNRSTQYAIADGKLHIVVTQKDPTTEFQLPADKKLATEVLTRIARLACSARFVKLASGVKDVPADEEIEAKPGGTQFRVSVSVPGAAAIESAAYAYHDAKTKQPEVSAVIQAIVEASGRKVEGK